VLPEPVQHEDLVLYALGRLPPRRREEVAAQIARDPTLARESERITRHLALYDRLLPPPAPPAFDAVRARLGAQARRRVDPLRVFVWAGAAAILVALVGVFLFPPKLGSERGGWSGHDAASVAPPGLDSAPGGLAWEATPAGPRLRAFAGEPGEIRLEGGRVRVVLDAGAALTSRTEAPPRLEGRAWFEVGPGPFALATEHGLVEVLGTAFEVDARDGLLVRVVEGRVRALGREAGPGESIAKGQERAEGLPGAFARRPRLHVTVQRAASSSDSLRVRLLFQAPPYVGVELPGPSTVASAAWLAFTRPDGTDATVGLDLAALGIAMPQPGRAVRLEAGTGHEVVFEVPRPPGPPGTWRLAALYRPEGEAALASEPVSLEVR
jgi:ferric-dicitrate binding protein FerR (iron transport regulator)